MPTHDMTTIVHPLNLLVSDELDRASKIHGAVFASPHEGYGVIAEEADEAYDECENLDRLLSCLLTSIRLESTKGILDFSDKIRDVAVNAAAELVQVAAMCEKMARAVNKGK